MTIPDGFPFPANVIKSAFSYDSKLGEVRGHRNLSATLTAPKVTLKAFVLPAVVTEF